MPIFTGQEFVHSKPKVEQNNYNAFLENELIYSEDAPSGNVTEARIFTGKKFLPSKPKVKKENLRALSPRANYTDRATAACREASANFCGQKVSRGQRNGYPRPYSRISGPE
jgi:hypothetical protein